MTAKGLEVLKQAIDARLVPVIAQVVIGQDKSVQSDYSTELQSLCENHAIPFSFRSKDTGINTPWVIAVSWRWLVKSNHSRLIVLHDSLLPKYRGFAPLVNQLINGDTRVGVTAIHAVEEFDRGDIIFQESASIEYPITITRAIDVVSKLYGEVVSKILQNLRDGKDLPSIPQDESAASYSLWRDEQDYEISWQDSAAAIQRFVDAVGFPYRGASTLLNGSKVRILGAQAVEDLEIPLRTPGKVLFNPNEGPVIVCGKGLLQVTKILTDEGELVSLPLKKFRSRFGGNMT